MLSTDLIRYSGLAAVLGAAILIISDLLGFTVLSGELSEIASTGTYLADGTARVLAGILLLLGLIGLYARQAEASGVPGLVAFLVAFAGTALIFGSWWTNAFVAPVLAQENSRLLETGPTGVLNVAFTLSFALGAVGWLLFGLVSLRPRIYPRAAVILLMVGAVLTFVPLPGTQVFFEAAVAWLGFALFARQKASAGHPERVK